MDLDREIKDSMKHWPTNVMCRECGKPTHHLGDLCFYCTKAEKIAPLAPDPVNKPAHYNFAGIECIDAIKAALGPEGFRDYMMGNVLKYSWRYKYKNGLEDLKKAQWYLSRTIKELEDERKDPS